MITINTRLQTSTRQGRRRHRHNKSTIGPRIHYQKARSGNQACYAGRQTRLPQKKDGGPHSSSTPEIVEEVTNNLCVSLPPQETTVPPPSPQHLPQPARTTPPPRQQPINTKLSIPTYGRTTDPLPWLSLEQLFKGQQIANNHKIGYAIFHLTSVAKYMRLTKDEPMVD